MSSRTQGGEEFPNVHPSVHPPPLAINASKLPFQPSIQFARPRISSQPASNLSSKSQIWPLNLKSALQIFNQPSKHQVSPLWLKLAFQTTNLLSKPQFCPSAFKYAFFGLNQSSIARNVPPQDVWKFPPVFYRTSALWGRCPALTPLLHWITPSRASGTADQVRSLDD